MKLGLRRTAIRVMEGTIACLMGIVSAMGQTAPQRLADVDLEAKPLMAEQVFKNVQVLRGIPMNEFMDTMGFFAASLGMNCTDCHTEESVGNWSNFADETLLKQTARKMVLMVRTLNQANFGGKRMVTCYSCHRGSSRPEITPSLDEQYGAPPPEDPDRIQIHGEPIEGAAAEQILDKYIQALGGVEQLAKLTSFIATGTYVGYDSDEQKVPTEIFVKAPAQRAVIVHTLVGDDITTFNGREGWVAAVHEPLPLLALTGGDLEGARTDAELALPLRIKQDFTKWRAGFPDVVLDGHALQVVEGTTAGGTRVKLFFDKASGLLVRQMRSVDTLVGIVPMHVDYSDYRTVAGVKIPFHWVTTWTDGQSTTQLTEVQPNVAIDAAKFGKPAPAQAPKTRNRA